MIDEKYNNLPDELLAVGVSLGALGIAEIAWRSTDALKIVDFLDSKELAIIGGDVYAYDGTTVVSTCDSWYFNKIGSKDFVKESIKKAFEYIIKYHRMHGDNYIYSIIFLLS